MDIKRSLFIFVTLVASQIVMASHLWIEAESFENKGGWVVDQQFMDLMGSPYLMAHGWVYRLRMHLQPSTFRKMELTMCMPVLITGLLPGAKRKDLAGSF